VVPTSGNISTFSSWNPGNIYAVDVNNDGIPDLIQGGASAGITGDLGEFGVSVANGDGTFRAAVAYQYPAGVQVAPMAFGDFNGDGKIDIAIPAVGKNQVTALK
jgi:hypothetical protein